MVNSVIQCVDIKHYSINAFQHYHIKKHSLIHPV